MSNLNVPPESPVSDQSETGFIFDDLIYILLWCDINKDMIIFYSSSSYAVIKIIYVVLYC